ncbi:MinD/ParA family protein [Anaerolineae bacterium CFX9]|jgi:MinD-like ATPase involved in chromosome partitioning or flagellar assembly|nr:MinD/ParA family protein [Anaerolineae bacterium CFX9]
MGEIISIHSFRGGTGKSNLAANLSYLLAKQGSRVGIVDTDIQSPGVHVLFGFDETRMTKSLNDFLWGRAPIEDIAYSVSEVGQADASRSYLAGLNLWLIPSSIRTNEIARILREGYDVNLLNQGFHTLIKKLELDYLIIDTHPGLNEETLLSIAISNTLVVILRPDQQDFQGTAVTVDIARKLEVPKLRLVVNKALPRFDFASMRANIQQTYGADVSGILPLSEDVVFNASNHIFSALNASHAWTRTVTEIAHDIIS